MRVAYQKWKWFVSHFVSESRDAFCVRRSPFAVQPGGGASGGAVQGVQRVAELPRTSARTGQKFGSLLEKRLIRSAGESGRRKS